MPNHTKLSTPSALLLSYILIGVVLIFSSLQESQGQTPHPRQNAIFYSNTPEEGCTGSYSTFYGSVTISGNGLTSSSLQIYGLWRVMINSRDGTSFANLIYQEDEGCSLTATNYNSIQLTRYGDDNQMSSTINFYTSANLYGDSQTVNIEGLSKMPFATVGSYYFGGSHNWTLYEGENYTGTATCLMCNQAVAQSGYGFTYSFISSQYVGSVKYGCD